MLQATIERGELAGAAWLVERDGRTHVGTAGRQDLASAAPMRRDTIFHIASMTKPITATMAMMLVEEARLGLDDPVDPWLPELADRRVLRSPASPLDDTVAAERAITLRDLLTCRMGLGLVWAEPGTHPIQRAMAEAGLAPGPDCPPFGPDELMRRIGRLPLVHQPGQRWLYHTSFDVLGVLLARVAGQSLDALLADRLFAPLGMADTGFQVPDAKRHRLAARYAATSDGLRRRPASAAPPCASTELQSTLDDYAAFGRMLLAGGRHGRARLLASATVELMTTDHITPEQKATSPFFPGFWETHGWGFGMAMLASDAGPRGRFGWDGGFGTSWRADPTSTTQAILMIQRLYDAVTGGIVEAFWRLAAAANDD